MKRAGIPSIAVLLLLTPSAPAAITWDIEGGASHVAPSDTWRFFRGRTAPSTPITAWKESDFLDGAWESGPGGFGYTYTAGIGTVLSDMRNGYFTVYARREFTVSGPLDASPLELVIDYDDGFAAWLNGRLVAWRNLSAAPDSPGFGHQTPGTSHAAGTPVRIELGAARDLLVEGRNVFAIEGHNVNLDSSDLALVPTLRTASSAFHDGRRWVVEGAATTLRGTATAPATVSVRVGGAPAEFIPATDAWRAPVALSPGPNRILVEALDAGGAVIESVEAEVLLIPSSGKLTGTLPGDTVLASSAGGFVVEGELIVPAGATLRIEPGVSLYLSSGASITVRGALRAEGTAAAPILFTRRGEGARWRRIIFERAAESRFAHCTFEYADSEGAHQDYYEPGPRSYHEAVVALASRLELESCLFQNLPDDAAGAEGDALAIISDDPALPGAASAVVRDCRFIRIGQGIHARFSHVLVEGCFFTGKRGDNDDVDLWGESDPPPLIIGNRFIDPEHDDMINPTRCSAVIIGNFLTGGDDHGIVLRDRASPVVMNNVILDCANGGIAVENSNTALLVNNTIVNCGRGLRLFDLGRWDAPYFLNPGGGTATVVNCIIWDCPEPITLADSSNTTIADRGSHVTVHHSLVQRGRAGVSVSGSQSTVTWGEGNLEADPLFADLAADDARLADGSPAIDAGIAEGAPPDDLEGNPRPCGSGVDLGAHETCAAGPARFIRGDPNADGEADLSDAVAILFHLFAGASVPPCLESADANDDGAVEVSDALAVLGFLFLDADPLPEPRAACGPDPTPDPLGCATYPGCP